ncbi:MAG: DUF308 domain-containing protein [Chordicoccus sp.]
MTGLSGILGVLIVCLGISFLITPLLDVLTAGYALGILLLIFGLTGLFRSHYNKDESFYSIITDILALFTGALAFFYPGKRYLLSNLLLEIVPAWFLIEGICSVIVAIKERREANLWGCALIAGMLGCFVGTVFLIHPAATELMVSVMIVIAYLQTGLQMAAFAMFRMPRPE